MTSIRGRSSGMSNNYVGEQSSNYFLRKTKLKAIFTLLTGVRYTLNPPLSVPSALGFHATF